MFSVLSERAAFMPLLFAITAAEIALAIWLWQYRNRSWGMAGLAGIAVNLLIAIPLLFTALSS